VGELHVLAHVQHQGAPAAVRRLLARQLLDQRAEDLEALLRELGVFAKGVAERLLQQLLELAYLLDGLVHGLDDQVCTAVELRVAQAFVHQRKPRPDGAALLVETRR
jgi:hypothetical protein